MVGEKMVGDIEAVIPGSTRLVQQLHLGLLWGMSPFAPIAGDAGTDHIVPDMLPATPPGNDVVEGQLLRLMTAILARVVVPVEHL